MKKQLEATDAPPRERFFLQLSSDDPLTCLVCERAGTEEDPNAADIVGSFSLHSEASMAERMGMAWTDDPALMRESWRWRVEADGGNSGGGYFA